MAASVAAAVTAADMMLVGVAVALTASVCIAVVMAV
jgi:hypothetical protein